MTVKTSQKLPIAAVDYRLVVSFHFTTRTGCSVEVTPNDNTSVRVYIVMNSAGYTSPSLPTRNDLHYSIEDLNNAAGASTGDEVGEAILGALNTILDPTGTAILARGLKTDLYDAPPPVNFLKASTTNAALNVPANAIPAGQGITVDNSQPYPITGWIEVGYVSGLNNVANAPLDPVNPVSPSNPTNPVNPVHPIDPTDPARPILPVNPIEPVKPVEPIGPIRPLPTSEK